MVIPNSNPNLNPLREREMAQKGVLLLLPFRLLVPAPLHTSTRHRGDDKPSPQTPPPTSERWPAVAGAPQTRERRRAVMATSTRGKESKSWRKLRQEEERKREEHPTEFKIAVIGDRKVGKTSVIERIVNKSFSHNPPPTSASGPLTHPMRVEGQDIIIEICERRENLNNGQPQLALDSTPIEDNPLSRFYQHVMGVIIVFDLTWSRSFMNIRNWISEFKLFTDPQVVVGMVIGNKVDLMGKADSDFYDEADTDLFDFGDMEYKAASACVGTDVEEAFQSLVQKIYQRSQIVRRHRSSSAPGQSKAKRQRRK